MNKAVTSIWCRSCSGIRTSRRRRSTSVVNYATARETVEAMALAAEPYRTGRKSHSISLTTCHTSKSKTQPTRKGYEKQLSNALRVADPTSEQFSGKKYGEHLALHRSAKTEALQERYKRAVLKYADFLEKQIEQGQERIEALTYLLDKASEEIPRRQP